MIRLINTMFHNIEFNEACDRLRGSMLDKKIEKIQIIIFEDIPYILRARQIARHPNYRKPTRTTTYRVYTRSTDERY